MKKFKIKKSFQNKNFKYGGMSAIISVIVIVALIFVNFLASKYDYKFDFTKNRLFSLSDQTYKVLKTVNSDITFYVLQQPGNEDSAVNTILQKYSSNNKKIKIEYKDPAKYPEFAKQYSSDGNEISTGSIVVVCGKKFKVVDSNDIINISYDSSGQAKADSLAIEQLLTSAIVNVTSDKAQVIIALSGHEEGTLPSEVTKQLELENYTVNQVDLLTKDAKLDTADTLLIYSPQKDLSADETAKIKEFLAKGGRALFLMDIAEGNLPNFQSVLNVYGVGLQRAIVVEGDSSHSSQNPIYLLPNYGQHEIVYSISAKNLKTVMPVAQAIEILKNKKDTTEVTPLLTTSDNSWGKVNIQTQTIDKEKGDLTGPFNIAVAVTDTPKDTSAKATKLVVVSNGYFINSKVITQGGNMDFLMNSVNFLQDKKDSISIRPKSLQSETITISVLQRLLLSGLVVIVIPLIVILMGVVRVIKRKRL